jgi:hypothetical protein
LLKFFWINHRDEQIGEQRDGNEADNNVFHKNKSLEFFAPAGVKLAGHKESRDDAEINQVSHKYRLTLPQPSRLA